MNSIAVRLARLDEYKTLAECGRETFYETWKDYNTESDMQVYLKEAFDDKKIQKDLENSELNTFYLAFDEETLIGYAKVRNDRSPAEFDGDKALEIERVYVRTKYHGSPAGKLLMAACLDKAKIEKYDWIWLGVNIDNHRAIAFYYKYGFVKFGTKMFKLGDAEDQDYLMKLKM